MTSTALAVTRFDYALLDAGGAEIARTAANLIRLNLLKEIEAVVAVGQQLIAVKNALDHGQFGAWLKAETPFAETTAQNYMRVVENIGSKSATVADLPRKLVYQLASPLVPEETRQQIFVRREAGERVEKEEITEIVSTAISNAKEAAKMVAEEAQLSARAKARRKAVREQERANRERREVELKERREREREATEKAAALIIQKLGPDIIALRTLLEDAWADGIIDEIKTPGFLKERDAAWERRHG
jgi:hypothetical protein